MAYKSGVMKKCIILLLLVLVFRSATAGAYDKAEVENWLRHAESTLARTESYTAIFHKQERIQERLTDEETIFLKFKRPFKVYMKWAKEPHKGRESLYIEGHNDNLLKVRECGIAGIMTVNIDPKGALVMKGSRHPVTDSGLENLVKLIRENFEKGVKAREIDLREQGEERVYGRTTKRVEIIFPKNNAGSYYCYRALINLDVETKLPVRVHIYGWDDTLLESYGYEAIKLDAGLTEADFDPTNSEYRF
ncbi:MAG: DUF1571 domain-containing protein [Thermodesulfovibrionales bacterium]